MYRTLQDKANSTSPTTPGLAELIGVSVARYNPTVSCQPSKPGHLVPSYYSCKKVISEMPFSKDATTFGPAGQQVILPDVIDSREFILLYSDVHTNYPSILSSLFDLATGGAIS